jgi:hypothetical protein
VKGSVRKRRCSPYGFWLLSTLAAACTGGDPNLGTPDAGSPADAFTIDDRTPVLDLDAILGRETQTTGDEPQPPPEPCDPDAGADEPPDTNDDIYGIDGCRPVPSRLIVLGDSVALSFQDDTLLTPRFRDLAPNVDVEGYAEAGSGILSLPLQARRAAPGPEHLFVFIWSIGNDFGLAGSLEAPDADLTSYQAAFGELFGYFGDQARFPGGATFLLNTQYVPRDNCAAPGAAPWRGPEAVQRLLDLNKLFFLDVAEARPDAAAIDHYPDFLGHAANANIKDCPHCGQNNAQWTDPYGIHPNGAGQTHVAEKWAVAFAGMLGPACGD